MKSFMIYSKHSKLSSDKTKNIIKDNSTYILMFSVFLCGIIIGTSLSLSGFIENSNLSGILYSYLYEISDLRFFITNVCSSVIFILLTLFSGLSCTGIPAISVIIILRGCINGITAGYLLVNSKIKGFAMYSLEFVPGEIIFITAFIMLSIICINISGKLVSSVIFNTESDFLLKNQSARIGILILLCLSSCFINQLFRMLFFSLF